MSSAKIQGILTAAIGAVVGVIYGVVITVISLLGKDGAPGILIALGTALCAPILYGAMGFIAGALTAFIYNMAAKAIGGVQFEFEKDPND